MTNEQLYEQYLNGNFDTVRAHLKSLPPLKAGIAIHSLFENVMHDEGVLDCSSETAYLLSKRLQAWSEE
jgi:hypothetical protein